MFVTYRSVSNCKSSCPLSRQYNTTSSPSSLYHLIGLPGSRAQLFRSISLFRHSLHFLQLTVKSYITFNLELMDFRVECMALKNSPQCTIWARRGRRIGCILTQVRAYQVSKLLGNSHAWPLNSALLETALMHAHFSHFFSKLIPSPVF